MDKFEMCKHAQEKKQELIEHMMSDEPVTDGHLLQYLAYRGICEDMIMYEQKKHVWDPLNESLTHNMSHDDMISWVNHIENKDGTTGAHWTIQQTDEVNKQYNIADDSYVAWTALNAMYSDYYQAKYGVEDYAHMAKDFLHDKDSKKTPMERLTAYYRYVK